MTTERTIQDKIFVALDEAMCREFPIDCPIPLAEFGSAMASLFGQYCASLAPTDRFLLLSEVVDRIVQTFHKHYNDDLLLN